MLSARSQKEKPTDTISFLGHVPNMRFEKYSRVARSLGGVGGDGSDS